jgi:hypothetical protein
MKCEVTVLHVRLSALYNRTFGDLASPDRPAGLGWRAQIFALIDRGARVPHHGGSCYRKRSYSTPLPYHPDVVYE